MATPAAMANLARMSTTTTGTGTVTLGSAVSGFKAFPSVLNGQTITYAIADGDESEIGRGVYTHSGLTLTRAVILSSTNGDSAISLSGAAEVFITPAAEDFGGDTRVRLVAASNVSIATALENGDTIDSVTLVTGDVVLLTAQSTTHENGPYRVPASGAASRAFGFTTYDAIAGQLFKVDEGTVYADTIWLCTSNKGGTLGSTALAFASQVVPAASETVPGIVERATTAEVLAATDAQRFISPLSLGTIFRLYQFIIADDNVETISIGVAGATGPFGLGMCVVNVPGYDALFSWGNFTSTFITPLVEGANAATLDWTTGVLGAGGGTDGRLTLSIHTDGLIYISNRLGGSIAFSAFIFTGAAA